MQKVSSFFDVRRTSGIVVASFVSILMVALLTYGATTISTNISTGGTLDVTGASTFTGAVTANGNVTLGNAAADVILSTGGFQASSTALLGSTAIFYGNLEVDKAATATVTFGQAGINFDSNTFVIDPNANRVGVLTATPNAAFEVVGSASTTDLRVGGFDGANGLLAGLLHGTCNLTTATLAASTTANFACTSATGVQSGDKVFVMATSSLSVANPYNNDIVIRSASSSVSGQINVDIVNTDDNSDTETVAGTLNFWAVR